MSRKEHHMRKYKTEAELRTIAEDISRTIYIRTMDGGNSHDKKRKSRSREQSIIYSVAYGALLALNWGEQVRSNRDMEQAIVDSAEFTLDLLIREFYADKECNGYMTIYCPLKRVLQNWEEQK